MSKTKKDRLRGQRTHGKGNTKNRRGHGATGGKGRAGSFKHKRFSFMAVTNQHTKKKLKYKERPSIITLEVLSQIVGDRKEINLKEMGYDKIIGKGNLSKPLIIKNAQVTAGAKEKIEKIGGRVE